MSTSSPSSAIRYDRQVRLWGEEGQSSIGQTTVCMLGSNSLGSEILKSLVLAGIRSFVIVDNAKIMRSDTGENFFVHSDNIGRYRAEVILETLKELNPSVSGECSLICPSTLTPSDLTNLSRFSVVVTANMSSDVEKSIAAAVYPLAVPLVCVKTYGLLGCIKICIREHFIANSHEENARPDLRLDVPFEKLVEMVNETNLEALSIEELRHTPYILLLFKALEIYRQKRNDASAFPDTYADRKEMQTIVMSLRRASEESGSKDSDNFDETRSAVTRAFQRTTISESVCEILKDEHCQTSSQPFWLICEGIRRFVEKHGVLPLRGTLPDMTSDSARYARLATMFHEKALADAQEVLLLTREAEKERGVGDLISEEMCYRFCKNAHAIRLQRGDAYDYELELKSLCDNIKNMYIEDENSKDVDCSVWLLLIRAVEKFQREKGRYPGTNGVPCTIDAFDLKQRVDSIVKNADSDNAEKILSRIPADAISEMCRFGAAELHVVSSFVGGIASQEVIKLATNQYVPLDNTFIFDGHTQKSTRMRL